MSDTLNGVCQYPCESVKMFELPPDFPIINGVTYSPETTPEFLRSIRGLPVQKSDVIVATYLKSGTTWTSEILWQMFTDGSIDERQIVQRTPFLECFPWNKEVIYQCESNTTLEEYIRNLQPPRIFKTHLQHHLVPAGEGANRAKYIYVMRNPKDVAVSFYHHMRYFTFYQFNGSWDEFFEIFIKGKVEGGSWFDNVLGWWKHRDDANVLFLKYEDMKKDLKSTVREIAKFVGNDIGDELINKITRQTSFEAMKNGKQFYQDNEKLGESINPAGGNTFIRKGVVGSWRKYFTAEQNRRFNEIYMRKMSGSGLELEFH